MRYLLIFLITPLLPLTNAFAIDQYCPDEAAVEKVLKLPKTDELNVKYIGKAEIKELLEQYIISARKIQPQSIKIKAMLPAGKWVLQEKLLPQSKRVICSYTVEGQKIPFLELTIELP